MAAAGNWAASTSQNWLGTGQPQHAGCRDSGESGEELSGREKVDEDLEILVGDKTSKLLGRARVPPRRKEG
jgi:hypothetical protein